MKRDVCVFLITELLEEYAKELKNPNCNTNYFLANDIYDKIYESIVDENIEYESSIGILNDEINDLESMIEDLENENSYLTEETKNLKKRIGRKLIF